MRCQGFPIPGLFHEPAGLLFPSMKRDTHKASYLPLQGLALHIPTTVHGCSPNNALKCSRPHQRAAVT